MAATTTSPVRRTGVRVDLFVALDRLDRRVPLMGQAREGIVLDVVTETYNRQRRRWTFERRHVVPPKAHLHEEFDVPLVLVYRHKRYRLSEPVLVPWRETAEGTTEAARGAISGGMITGEVLARFTGAWPEKAGRMFRVFDQPMHEGFKWTPIVDAPA
jgi:hypothetical protein